MTNNLNGLSPRVLKRLERIALEEEAKFQKALAQEKEQLDILKGNQQHIAFGSLRDTTVMTHIEGVPVLLNTDGQSKVTNFRELTPEVFNSLEVTDQQAIKQQDGVLYNRLKHNDLPSSGSKSDRFYELMDSTGMKAELMIELGKDYEKEYGANAWEHFSSPENRHNKISKRAEFLQETYSDEYRINLGKQILDLEDKIAQMEETGEIIGDISISEGGQAQ